MSANDATAPSHAPTSPGNCITTALIGRLNNTLDPDRWHGPVRLKPSRRRGPAQRLATLLRTGPSAPSGSMRATIGGMSSLPE